MSKNSANSHGEAWQTKVVNSAAMLEAILSREEFCDVVFKVRAGGLTENIKAHRAVLAARSPVFASMFYGSLPEKEPVEIMDVSPDVFKVILKYVYTDCTADITVDNLLDAFYVAHKYNIEPLRVVCADKVKECISMENIEDFLSVSETYEDTLMRANCLAFIKTDGWKLFQKKENYIALPRKYLMLIWQRDLKSGGLNKLPEVDIYKGAITWAKAECERQGIPGDDPKNQRLVLGAAFDLLSFGRMSLEEFHNITVEDSLLTWKEVARMSFYLANVQNAVLPFGQPAPPRDPAQVNELIRRSDGHLVQVRRELLETAVAGKVTCGCDCKGWPRKQCDVRSAEWGCNCNCTPRDRCDRLTYQINRANIVTTAEPIITKDDG